MFSSHKDCQFALLVDTFLRTWKRISLNATAASLILAAGVGPGMKFSGPTENALPGYVLQHVYDELPLLTSTRPVNPASLQKAQREGHLKVSGCKRRC